MLLDGVAARLLAGGQAVVDVTPVIRRYLGRVDADRLDRIDDLEDALDLRPALHLEEAVAAGAHEGQRLIALAGRDRAHDVDAREDSAVVVGGPAHEGESAVGREGEHAAAPVEDLLVLLLAEADPVFDLLLDPGQLDACQAVGGKRRRHEAQVGRTVHGWSPSAGGNSRASRSRSMSATVRPRWKAAILMRPRSAGVMSIVSRAVNAAASPLPLERGSGVLIQRLGSAGRAMKARFGERCVIAPASRLRPQER